MVNLDFEDQLVAFYQSEIGQSKGKLSVVLHVTRVARDGALPLEPGDLRTPGKGQVVGLSRSSIQSILADYGIHRVLAQEGGRTSRGSLGLMEKYVGFLNSLYSQGLADMSQIEAWWVEKVRLFFASQPLVLHYDVGFSLRSMIADLLEQTRKRQEENPGATYMGSVLQHLVGAKLELVLTGKQVTVEHHGASVADIQTQRAGDFVIHRTAIHVTTAPSQMLLQKCKENLAAGYRPIIVTLQERAAVAEGNAQMEGIGHRVDILAIEQFLTANLHELSGFHDAHHEASINELITQYNKLIDEHETDPSLKIRLNT
ncbi:MAG: DUF4928 family protein [Caldilineaceae bacterium]|nr:DUF4928 family protein [Caldilineaceae bacterium]MCB0143674.1 DUF4928 family protein [Caldilineaceae bacterium]